MKCLTPENAIYFHVHLISTDVYRSIGFSETPGCGTWVVRVCAQTFEFEQGSRNRGLLVEI